MVTFYKPKAKTVTQKAFEVECVDLDLQGRGVAKKYNKTWFISNLIPGEKARVVPVAVKDKTGEAKVTKFIYKSDNRAKAQCPLEESCGGCPLAYVKEDDLLANKVKGLYQLLKKTGVALNETPSFVVNSNALNYRRACRLAIRIDHGKVTVGFREGKSQKLVSLTTCKVLSERINEAIPKVIELLNKLQGKRNLGHLEFIDSEGALGIFLRVTENLSDEDLELIGSFGEENSYVISVGIPYKHEIDSSEHVKEILLTDNEDALFINASDCKIICKPTAFVQVNKEVNKKLIKLVLDAVKPHHGMKVLDLFCGLGNFTLPLAKEGAEVLGIDIVASMIKDAQKNAELNDLHNAKFAVADLEDDFEKQQWAKVKYDAVVLDPGRMGAKRAALFVSKLKIPKIVMISCNPLAASRDIRELIKSGYKITAWGALDMFPRTSHIELMTVFSL